FHSVKKLSKECGALGGGISGSGPSIFMLSREESVARQVETVMSEIYTQAGIDFKTYVTTINSGGARVSQES
ncbi:MAG TPA: homoserine kinase, partial [Flavitalea sp.]|nr:homoserine kinase [Flavitalea sp.]